MATSDGVASKLDALHLQPLPAPVFRCILPRLSYLQDIHQHKSCAEPILSNPYACSFLRTVLAAPNVGHKKLRNHDSKMVEGVEPKACLWYIHISMQLDCSEVPLAASGPIISFEAHALTPCSRQLSC